MGKRMFISPEVRILKLDVGPGEDDGAGSTGFDQEPVSYEDWKTRYSEDLWIFDANDDGNPGTFEDYEFWMEMNGWEYMIDDLNPDRP